MKIYEICYSVAHLLVSVAQHGIISSFHAVTVKKSYKWKYNSYKLRLIYHYTNPFHPTYSCS